MWAHMLQSESSLCIYWCPHHCPDQSWFCRCEACCQSGSVWKHQITSDSSDTRGFTSQTHHVLRNMCGKTSTHRKKSPFFINVERRRTKTDNGRVVWLVPRCWRHNSLEAHDAEPSAGLWPSEWTSPSPTTVWNNKNIHITLDSSIHHIYCSVCYQDDTFQSWVLDSVDVMWGVKRKPLGKSWNTLRETIRRSDRTRTSLMWRSHFETFMCDDNIYDIKCVCVM